MEKNPVGRPRLSGNELAERKTTTRSIAFKNDTFEKLNDMRGNESLTSFINRLIDEQYLRV